ncbi:MAG: hypothetical protein IT176_11595 [Acidobacteria bacterium]|nr:hypothetical protein [Acidobacteriota bacterium]
MTGQLAVLSYHGWEVAPSRLAADVARLRADGWRDCSLAEVEAIASGDRACDRRYFHVTLDDGAEQDLACVDALEGIACPATLFISLETMTAAARQAYSTLIDRADPSRIVIADHSLRHQRIFTSRRLVGFHAATAPLMSSPERLGLQTGDPVCAYGGELSRPQFTPDPRATARCRLVAAGTSAPPSSAAWTAALENSLLDARLAFRRFGRLCLEGRYETREEFRTRLDKQLCDGREALAAFLGRAPWAFAHPWWQPSPASDRVLRSLGYRLTFSGLGLWRDGGAYGIPRLFVSNATPRPLAPQRATAFQRMRESWAAVQEAGRRVLWA